MKRFLPLLLLIAALSIFSVACGAADAPAPDGEQSAADTATDTAETETDAEPDPEPTAVPAAEPTEVPTEVPAEASAEADEAMADDSSSAVMSEDGIQSPPEDLNIANGATEANMVRDYDRWKGAEDHTVLIIEYGDFQCPGCRALAPVLDQLVKDYPDHVKLVYRHFPLDQIHPNANKAAQAAEAAGAQGAFWEFHDALYARQDEFAAGTADEARDVFIDMATQLNLNIERFTADLDSDAWARVVSANQEEAVKLGMPGTPAILIDGLPIAGANLPMQIEPYAQYVEQAIEMAAFEEQQYDAPPDMAIDTSAVYLATVTMESGGEFVMELYPESAPLTVNSFVFLANEGWFNGVTFHRVLPDFVAQTGDPTGTGRGGPGYTIPNEIDSDLTHSEIGMVAMANSGPDTNGSQWYITLGDAAFLDGSYTLFGRVVEGLESVQAITARDPQRQPTFDGDAIQTIEISVKE